MITKASKDNRGGDRPTAPQNNPANISATGGAGQSGTQGAKYYSGMPFGQGQAIMAQQQGAPMAANPVASIANQTTPLEVLPITAPTTEPDVPVTNGAVRGKGEGLEALQLPSTSDTDTDKTRLLSYLPALEVAAQSPNSSQAFRNYVRVLRANIR